MAKLMTPPPPRDAGRTPVTIVDVARESGVSVRTVSRVLNGGALVSAKNLARVRGAIEKFNFVPSISARALAGPKTYTLGLIFGKLSSSYLLDIQLAALQICHRHGYRLIIEQFGPDVLSSAASISRAVDRLRIDGAIVLPPLCDHLDTLDALDAAGIFYTRLAPTVSVERSRSVSMDDAAATRAMVTHLVEIGHRRIGFIAGAGTHASAHRRLEAFQATAKALHLSPSDLPVAQGDYSFDSGVVAAHALLDRSARPTAIFAANDAMAAGAVTAAGMRGLLTPRDLSICGFDDSALSRQIWPTLTTIRQPVADMAAAATSQLISPDATAVSLVFDFCLLVRASTAPPSAPG